MNRFGLAVFAVLAVCVVLRVPAVAQPAEPAGVPAEAAPPAVSGPIVRSIDVEGNQRIEEDTIISYMSLKIGEPYTSELVDVSLKVLYATSLFADVTITGEDGAVHVRVVENPLINRVAFEGNSHLGDEDLEKEAQLRPRMIFTRAKAQQDIQRIIEVYRRAGRFAASVEPKIVLLPQNRIDLIYEIVEGEHTGIIRVNFVGNEIFGDSDLRDQIITTESAWWKFLTSNDNYDPDRLAFDREQLRRFYLTNGYADFRVVSAVAELARDKSGFFVTFTVEEGPLYSFGTVVVQSQLAELPAEDLRELIDIEEGDLYNAEMIDKSIDTLTYSVGTRGFASAEIKPRVRRNRETQTIDLTFEVNQGPRVYVERINIIGNTRTLDRVIRREIRLAEGDAFNRVLIDRSRTRIRALGFFKTVDIAEEDGSAPDRKVLNVKVEEQSTGEFSMGLGYSSTEGFIGDVSLTERNLLGKGQFLRLRLSGSQRRQQIDLRFTEPYMFGRNLAAGFDIYKILSDYSESSFETDSVGGGLRFAFPLTEYSRLGGRLTVRQDENTPDTGASSSIQLLRGVSLATVIGATYSYDDRDDPIKPKHGWVMALDADVGAVWISDIPCAANTTFCPGVPDADIFDVFFEDEYQYYRVEFDARYYQRLFTDDLVAMIGLSIGYVDTFSENGGIINGVRISERFFKGAGSFRGFESSGVGPRDIGTGDDAVGGQFFAIGTIEVSFPNYLPEEFGVDTAFFTDFGTVGLVEQKLPCLPASCVKDDLSLRMSAGISVFWDSPFGRVRLDFAHVFMKEDYDKTEGFRFSAGTQF